MSRQNQLRLRLAPARWILLGLIALEVIAFGRFGTNFFTVGNAFEVARLNVEVGLLAVALTPVIVTGGIDLSVGSLMGLAAIVFGLLWRDRGLPIPVAAGVAVGMSGLLGASNGWLITRLRIPPLIVTLGSFSLFRGLAEGLTGGTDNVTHFPDSFLALGQGYGPGGVPYQLPVFVVVLVGFAVLLHRSTVGRAWVAIGFAPEGARYAGLPVDRRVTLAYVLSGLTAGLAAVVYVARLGQAKADAGTGYELAAITAVVLGGTSIFGGRGSVGGTLLGVVAIALMQNGLRLAALPAEFAGILTGALLLVAIGLDRRPGLGRGRGPAPIHSPETATEEFTVKNGQVVALCLAILAAGLLVAGTNVYLIRSTRVESVGGPAPSLDPGMMTLPRAEYLRDDVKYFDPASVSKSRSGKRLTVAMMPKSKGNAYFIACRKGAEEAAKERNIDLVWDGPTEPDPAKQNEVIDAWITRGVDVIAVAVENRQGISSVLRKARAKGIRVVTWDADAEPDSRDFFVNQATPQGIGDALMDNAARVLGGKGQFAIITASLTASNMIDWQKAIEARRQAKYPDITMAALRPCDDLQKKAFDEANTLLAANPDIKLFMAICTPAVPGAAEAVKQAGRSDVKVLGLGLPNENKSYVHAGITDCLILWKTVDLGYLSVLAAQAVHDGTLKAGATAVEAGRLGKVEVAGDNILLGKPFAFTRENIDEFDF